MSSSSWWLVLNPLITPEHFYWFSKLSRKRRESQRGWKCNLVSSADVPSPSSSSFCCCLLSSHTKNLSEFVWGQSELSEWAWNVVRFCYPSPAPCLQITWGNVMNDAYSDISPQGVETRGTMMATGGFTGFHIKTSIMGNWVNCSFSDISRESFRNNKLLFSVQTSRLTC